MAAITPPLFESVDSVYTAAALGLPYRDWVREGVLGSADMAVTERSGGANMSVDVAAGVAWVQGDDSTIQPAYRCYNDNTVNLAIDAASPSQARIDRVVAEVRDAAFSGVSTDWRLRVITGTPSGSPVAPALPNNAITLATVSVAAAASSVVNANITDGRPRAQLGASGGMVPVVTSLPPLPHDGMVVDLVADSSKGVVWRFRYRSGSPSGYRWEFVGGHALYAVVDTDQGTSSTTYVALGGPSVVVPLTGEYSVAFGASSYNSGANSNIVALNFGSGGNDAFGSQVDMAAANKLSTHSRTYLIAALGAGTTVSLNYRVTGGTGQFRNRWMMVTPVRVG